MEDTMQYKAEVKRYDEDDEDEATFDTWEQAAEWLDTQRRFHGHGCSMWVNNQRVKFQDGGLVKVNYAESDLPTSMATNAKLMEADAKSTVASVDRACSEMDNAMAQFNHLFRPQPTRDMAPQNPQTLKDKGESL
jgi:hypothetical protein